MKGTTVTGNRNAAIALLMLAATACGAGKAPLQELYRGGYGELEAGNLDVAKRAAEEGLRRAQGDQRSSWERAFRVLEAEILVGQRQLAEALDLLDPGIIQGWPDDVVLARALMTRAYAHCLGQETEHAVSRVAADMAKAADIADAVGDGKLVVEVMLRRGTCAALHQDTDTATNLFRETMEMAHRRGLWLIAAQAAGNLGNVQIGKGQYDDAVRWLRRSQELVAGRPADGLRAGNSGRLGWCYYRLGDYERAVQALSRAESYFRRLGHIGDRYIALDNLGRALQRLGDHAGAEKSFRRAVAVARDIQDPARVAEARADSLVSLATLALRLGHFEEAAAQAAQALRIQTEYQLGAERQRTRLLQGEIWARRGEPLRAARHFGNVVNSPYSEPTQVWEAYAALARLNAQARRPARAEAHYQQAFELMETSLGQLLEAELQLPFFASLGRFFDEYVGFLVDQGRVAEALQAADDSRARLLQERLLGAGTERASGIDYRGLARDLDTLLLFYWTAPERSFLWAVTANEIEFVPLPEEKVLETLVTTYQERIFQSRDPIGEADPEGAELYRLLVQPAVTALASAERVVVVPDGPLHQLNFETLVVPGPEPHYLIQDAVLVRAPSLRLLSAEEAAERADAPSLLVLGDPVSPSDEFPPLPFAGHEIDSIGALFPVKNRRIYLQEQAKRSAYRNAELERFTYIHFAAHAQTNAIAPLESAVVLSAGDQDFKLYAREIVDIPLDADLVTLSACRSAGGRAFAGEGLVGLSWAFLSAGARHVIGGLWQVEDASTAELMTHLYRELVAGAEPAVALRRAKLELLHSDTAYRKPYYWAPFVVYASRAGGSEQ